MTAGRSSLQTQSLYDQQYFAEQCDGAAEWARFDGTPATLFPRARRNLELLDLQPGQAFLELGCGRGEVAITAAGLGAHVTAVDYSAPALAMAASKLAELERRDPRQRDIRFVHSAANDLQFDNNTFDRVLMAEMIEHLAADEAAAILSNIYKMVKPGGLLLVYTYPNRLVRRFYPVKRWLYFLARRHWLPPAMPDTLHPHYRDYHLNEQSLFSLKSCLRNAGFDVTAWYDGAPTDGGPLTRFGRRLLAHGLLMNLTAVARKA